MLPIPFLLFSIVSSSSIMIFMVVILSIIVSSTETIRRSSLGTATTVEAVRILNFARASLFLQRPTTMTMTA
jgi:hypothetical protein